MSKQLILRSTALVILLLAAPAAAQNYHQTNLISDGSVAATFTDPNLKDPWGVNSDSPE